MHCEVSHVDVQEAQQSSMMDLEIADYERTVRSLHEAVAERDAKVQTLCEEINCKDQQCASLQKLLGMLSYTLHSGQWHLCIT